MTKNTSVIVGDHFAGFIESQIASGRFSSTSEVIRAGLRLLEEHDAKLKALQNALVAGERSGEPRAFDNAGFLERMRKTGAR
jgi:antitoxin ParD1/3/4